MAEVSQEVDLTINSMFASDANKNLLLRPAWNYDREHGANDGRDRILNQSAMNRFVSGTIRLITEDEWRYQELLRNLEKDSVQCFRSLFDDYPDWYKLENPYDHIYDDEECERCGCPLHMLNKVYNVCKKCDDILQEDNEQIWSVVIPPFTPEERSSLNNSFNTNLARAEEAFFAGRLPASVTEQIETGVVPDRIMNLETGDETIIQRNITVEQALADIV